MEKKYLNAEDVLKEKVSDILKSNISSKLEVSTEELPLFNYVWNTSEKVPIYKAKICLIPEVLQAIGVKPLLIIVWKKGWGTLDIFNQNLLLFHELYHITFNDKDKIKLRQHDVQDFRLILAAAGLNWEKAEDFFTKSENE